MKRLIAVFLVLGLAIVPGLVNVKESAGQAARPRAIVEGGNRATPLSWARLPRVAQRATRVAVPRFSNLDPATLRRLKGQAARGSAPAAGVTFPRTPRPRTPGGALPPTTLFGFEGPSQADNDADLFLSRPPDPDIAVGPNHVGVVVNQQFTVFGKGGVQLAQTALATWFAGVCAGCSPFDPRIAYDPWENRWILIALELTVTEPPFFPPNTSRLLVSVSTTSDPTGSWCNYNIDAKFTYDPPGPAGPTDVWLDYPDVGFDAVLSTAPTSGAIYFTGSNFTFSPFGLFQTSSARVIPKSALYACAALPAYFHYIDFLNLNGSQAFTLRAAKTYGSNPGVEYMVNSEPVSGANFLSLWAITPTYPPAAPSAVLQANVVVTAYAIAPNATQPGCANVLDTIDNRLYNAVWRNNRIYTALTAASGSESQVRYYKINTMTNAAEFDNGFATAGEFSFMPAVTVDLLENLYIVYARSGPGTFGQLDQAGRQGGTFFFGSPIKTGVQCITGLRWGDYFGAAIDPVGFRRAWLFGQWASNEVCCDSVWDWSTWIARVQFSVLTTIGLYNGGTSTFFLRDSNTAGVADLTFGYGPAAGWTPIFGDWDGDGVETIGLYDGATSTFFLRNSNSAGVADLTFGYGPAGAGWVPVVGDWDGDGKDTIGLFNGATSTFFLRNSNSAGVADGTFGFGPAGAGWTPLAGDWNGDGYDTIGLFNGATSTFFLRNTNTPGVADLTFGYGPAAAGWLPRVGDWDGNNTDTVGLYSGGTSTFFLRNSNSAGVADITFGYGPPAGWIPGAGDWNGQ